MPPRVLCIGGATVDRTYRAAAPLVPETSNPAAGWSAFGGVARNVAESLNRLGCDVELLSRVGEDEGGRALLRHLDAAGIGRRGTAAVPGAATAEYVAVLTAGGDLALGLAAMAIFDHLTPEALGGEAAAIGAAGWLFADCNVPAASLQALMQRRWGGSYRLAVDAVSVAKSARLPDRLAGIDLLFVNRDEAAVVMARRGLPDRDPAAMAAALRAAGAGAAVVTLGAEGAIAATAEGTTRVPAEAAEVVDVTGAGDALIAATLAAVASGATLAQAVRRGCAAAARAVAVPSATGMAGRPPPVAGNGRAQGHKTVNGIR